MLNQTVMVGRLVTDPEVNELESGKKVTNVTLAVPRSYKNAEGEYETDFVPVTLWNGVAESTAEYCHKGDMVGIKGFIKMTTDKENHQHLSIVAEKVTFLSKTKEVDNETEKKADDIDM